ncbi:ABC transporter permease [Thermospira aquatica]|uniref:ABC transporter permease subunit n=1 Tax=Thermospira aquatica TaxID=2828656 RepID=A0AAX3BBU2_9SPIR|nr:ABC transporter permease subunit [Thermospira aquatica]URA09581.1 ABC transporter permease subunit [Thermospira aquatica]
MITSLRGKIFFALGVVIFVLLWEVASFGMASSLLLPSPYEVAKELLHLLWQRETYEHLSTTLIRIGLGIVLSAFPGIILGILSGRWNDLYFLFQPWLLVFQSIPAIVWVLLSLLWFPRDVTPVVLAFLTTFPLWVLGIRQAILSVPGELLEMVDVFGVRGVRRYFALYFPYVLFSLSTTLRGTITLSIKIVVMAEVLAFPAQGIGARLFWAKTYVDIVQLFGWAMLLLLLSWGIDALFSRLIIVLKRYFHLEVE